MFILSLLVISMEKSDIEAFFASLDICLSTFRVYGALLGMTGERDGAGGPRSDLRSAPRSTIVTFPSICSMSDIL